MNPSFPASTVARGAASLALVCALAALSACDKPASVSAVATSADLHQEELCYTNNFASAEAAKLCKPGQKVVFVPAAGSGGEQVAVMFAAANCDYRYAVVMGNNAVSCIYNPLKRSESAAAPASGPKP